MRKALCPDARNRSAAGRTIRLFPYRSRRSGKCRFAGCGFERPGGFRIFAVVKWQGYDNENDRIRPCRRRMYEIDPRDGGGRPDRRSRLYGRLSRKYAGRRLSGSGNGRRRGGPETCRASIAGARALPVPISWPVRSRCSRENDGLLCAGSPHMSVVCLSGETVGDSPEGIRIARQDGVYGYSYDKSAL